MKLKLMMAAMLIASVANADKVYLKSGSFLTGKVGAAGSGELTFDSDDLGEIKIKLENITKLEDMGEHTIKYTDGKEVTKKLAIKDGAYIADSKPIDMASVKAIDPEPSKWHGNINVAFNASRGNTYNNAAAIIANVNRRWDADRLNVDFGYHYGESGEEGAENQKTDDRWEVEGKHDHFWLEKVYSYEDLKWERDMIQQLRARYRAGIGLGYQWLEDREFDSTGTWNFNQELGVNWIREEYDDSDDDKKSGFCALRYAHHLTYVPKWVENLEFFHNLEILPDAGEWSKLISKCDVGFTTKLIYDFDLMAKIEWEFNSQPANDRKKDDIRYIIGLGYKW